MSAPIEALLLLGGNCGDVATTLDQAQVVIADRVGRVLAVSRDHWTEPWGFLDDQLFLNRALVVETSLGPVSLMEALLAIELELGRIRVPGAPPGPRMIDIDVLLLGDHKVDHPVIQIPHPRMHLRAFALAPSADIAPHGLHPVLGRTILQMLNDLHR